MTFLRNTWYPFAFDDGAVAGAFFPANSILITDIRPPFQFDALVQISAAAESIIPINIGGDIVDEPLAFMDTALAPVSLAPLDLNSAEIRNPIWNPGYSIGPSEPQGQDQLPGQQPITSESVAPPIAALGGDVQTSTAIDGIETLQDVGSSVTHWSLTPDFDDDPGWHPGIVWTGPFDPTSPRADNEIASPQDDAGIRSVLAAVVTDSADVPEGPPRDGTQASSLTFAELSEQYPGAIWPADWWLL